MDKLCLVVALCATTAFLGLVVYFCRNRAKLGRPNLVGTLPRGGGKRRGRPK